MAVKVEEVFKLKTAALLHDPPHKAFLMLKGLSHEDVAKFIAQTVFGDSLDPYLLDKRVKVADVVAASFDRWVLSLFMGGEYIPGAFRADTIKLKNIVAPWLEVDISGMLSNVMDDENVKGYVELLKILGGLYDWRWRYHLLYVLYELSWINAKLPVGPADTRVPTHSMYDHNYATAAVINWLLEDPNELRGLMVGVDVAGVQNYLMSSRKLRDMWTSSYIVSALTWYAALELVEVLGPDVVLTPSLRFNPFYIYWLANEIGARSKILKEMAELAYLNVNNIIKMYEELGIPPYSVIPGRLTLILPSWDTVRKLVKGASNYDNIREYLEYRFRRGWRILWEAVRNLAEARASRNAEWRIIRNVFEYYDKTFSEALFHENPPLTPRISWVEVKSSLQGGEPLWTTYDEVYRKLTYTMTLNKYPSKSPASQLRLEKLTLKAFESNVELGIPRPSKKGFDYCTSCGTTPAILILPGNEEDFNKAVGELAGGSIGGLELAAFKVIFKPGEKLCPWCFVKRVISLEPRLLKALLLGLTEDDVKDIQKLEGVIGTGPAPFGFPSVSYVASARLYEKLADVFGEQLKIEDLSEAIGQGRYVCIEEVKSIIGARTAGRWWFMRELMEKVEKAKGKIRELYGWDRGQDLILILDLIYSLDPEYLWFHERCGRDWEIKLRDVTADGIRLSEWLWRYYALIKADGDSIGKLLEGDPRALAPGLKDEGWVVDLLSDYIISSAEGPYRDVIKWCVKIAREVDIEALRSREDFKILANRVAESVGISVEEAEQRVAEVVRALQEIFKSGRMPVTPSYHVAISSALMRAALADIAIASVLDGFVVYAGGDDLMVFAPVDKALEFVSETRRSFAGASLNVTAGLNMNGGFLKLKEAYLPMLPSVGRSYVTYIAHYYYPLSTIISRASELLEEVKDKTLFNYLDSSLKARYSMKDLLVVAYNPRGTERVAWIPLSYTRPLKFDSSGLNEEVASFTSLALKLACYGDKRVYGGCDGGLLSHSFFYDFQRADVVELLGGLVDSIARGSLEALPTMASLVRMLLERNIRQAGGGSVVDRVYDEVFKPVLSAGSLVGAGWFEGVESSRRLAISNLVRVALLVLSGMR